MCYNFNVAAFDFIRKIIDLFNKKEGFLVLEVLSPESVKVSLVTADLDKKELTLAKVWTTGEFRSNKIKKIIGRFTNDKRFPAVVSLNSDLASTIYSVVSLVRTNSRDVIDEADLDNLISQAVWKFFDRHRAKVAQKLKVNDFDVILTDVRVEGIRLDGHKVVNPLGFKARSIEIHLCQTFTTRSVVNELRTVFLMDNVRLVTESGTAWSHVVARLQREPKLFVANIFSDRTNLFLSDGFWLAHYDNFEWGSRNLSSSVSEALALDKDTAEAVLARYSSGDISETFAGRLEKLLIREMDYLVKLLNLPLKETGIRQVYLHHFAGLPPLAFSTSVKNKFDFTVKLEPLTHSFISENHGYNLKFNRGVDARAAYGVFAAVIEALSVPQHSAISQMARRRVRWLTPAS